jgi:glycosyltransferase involved in cell wall biosynthesis
MPMRIAHLNLARGYRGGERQTELLIRGLSRDIQQILVARRDGQLASRLADMPGVQIRLGSGNLLSAAWRARGADIVHAHEGRAVYAAYLWHLVCGRPFIVTRRVNNPLGRGLLTRRAYRGAAFVACVSAQIAKIMAGYDRAIASRVIYSVGSGLRADTHNVLRLRAAHRGQFLVGHVGALDNAQKGQEHIIAAARKLAETHPDIHFFLVGGGDDEAMLKNLAKDLNNVTFTGFVHNVGDYLSIFDIFILPSNREGLGSILTDAMQFGLPVVAAAVGGVPEIVRDGENGFLIDPARPDQLMDAILRLHGDAGLRSKFGNRGREIASDFTPDRMARQYLKLYQSVLDQAQS